jgi:benzaldehyde dehydrogenase (NAD)
VQSASKAQPGWAATPCDRRAAVLRRAAHLLEEQQEEVEDWVVREAGLPRYFAGALGAAEEFRQAAALASAPRGQVLPSSQPRLSFTRRIPVGVVGVIAPFNAPLFLAARALAPALALGNAVCSSRIPGQRSAVVLCSRVCLRRRACRLICCMCFRVVAISDESSSPIPIFP